MACTTHSASEYVTNARKSLVGNLKNLSVILENLNRKGVLSDEEVCVIEAERNYYNEHRQILDSVKRKGEAACYEFLRILDVTRKWTLDKDLHYWISCFPFNEESSTDTSYLKGPKPCHRYQAKLKSKARKISNDFWTANKKLFEGNNKPDLSYTSLVLDKQNISSPVKVKNFKSKKGKKSRPKKLRTYIPENKAGTSPSDLLKTGKNILLVGKPGIGKTAVTHQILKLWAERDNEELDYMFYFDMREKSDIKNLEDLLFGGFSEPDEGKEEVLLHIKNNSDNVTLIFDGITDLSHHPSVVKRLVEKDLLSEAKIIVTLRPDDEEDFPSEDFHRVEVKGFNEQAIKTYLSAMLGEEQKKVLSNLELFTLCHVPMYALMVSVCFSSETPEDSPQPCSIADIYINIVRQCLQINSQTKNKDLNSFIDTKRNEILSLAEVAFHATEGKSVNLTQRPCEDSCVLSFLNPLVIKVAHTERITTYAFLHYTMQEFFAALWLLKNPDQIKDMLQQCLTEKKKHMKHLIPFMCRLLNVKNPSLMNCLVPAQELKNTSNWFFEEMIDTLCETDEAGPEDSGLDVGTLFLCQCLYESQCPEACRYLLDKLDNRLDLSGESLDPLTCCAVAYVVAQSTERKISLNLEDVMVSEQGMRQLFGCLKNVQRCDPLLLLLLWRVLLLSEGQMDHISLLGLDGNRLHLPVEGQSELFERAVRVLQRIPTKVKVCLHWERETLTVCPSLCTSLLEALPHISSLRYVASVCTRC
ncbi:protein NLRC5-like [Lycodopsis pacificus]